MKLVRRNALTGMSLIPTHADLAGVSRNALTGMSLIPTALNFCSINSAASVVMP